MKKCNKCFVEKPISEFYKQKGMLDGHVNKCKNCYKSDVRANRKTNIDYYRNYDVKRGNRQSPEYLKDYRKRFPKKYKAHNIVNNAVRDGKLFKQNCEQCDEIDAHAHHDDYDKPLQVRWLCVVHHNEWHSLNGEGANSI